MYYYLSEEGKSARLRRMMIPAFLVLAAGTVFLVWAIFSLAAENGTIRFWLRFIMLLLLFNYYRFSSVKAKRAVNSYRVYLDGRVIAVENGFSFTKRSLLLSSVVSAEKTKIGGLALGATSGGWLSIEPGIERADEILAAIRAAAGIEMGTP